MSVTAEGLSDFDALTAAKVELVVFWSFEDKDDRGSHLELSHLLPLFPDGGHGKIPVTRTVSPLPRIRLQSLHTTATITLECDNNGFSILLTNKGWLTKIHNSFGQF